MKIALVQTRIVWEDKGANFRTAECIMQEQSDRGIEAVFFPEMSFTGFSMNTAVTGETDRYTVKKISSLAKANNINIGFGWVENTEAKSKNWYSVVGRSGVEISSYAKIHPFSYSGEDKCFAGGDELSVFSIEGVLFSTFICYDLRFPELFRAVADKVHAIIIPACWPAKRSEHWKTLLRARAIENQVYFFAVKCVGDIGGQYYSGDSCIINPNGDIMKMLSNKEGVITYDFEDDVDKYRKQFPVLNDRRNELYRILS